MRILLLDLQPAGHSVQWVNFFAQYFTEQGHQVRFVTLELDEATTERLFDHDQFEAVAITDTADQSVEYRVSTTVGHFVSCFEMADQWDADVVHVLAVNRRELPLLAGMYRSSGLLSDISVVGTLVTPYLLGSQDKDRLTDLYHRANGWALRHLLRSGRLAKLFVLEPTIRNRLLKVWRVPPSSVAAVPDPVDPIPETRTQEAARRALDLPLDERIVLFFGSMRWEKGPDILLDAMTHVETSCTLVLAGSGDHVGTEEVERVRDQLPAGVQICDRIGFVPDEDVADYYRSADVVVLPYRAAYDGTSGILQHAAAARRPVVVTDAGSIGDIVREWHLGVIVEPGDERALAEAITEVITEDSDTEQFRNAVDAYVDAHHWRTMCERTLEAYQESMMHTRYE